MKVTAAAVEEEPPVKACSNVHELSKKLFIFVENENEPPW
jgi:hypothetical protein